jgi:hypothetical protein
MLEGGPVLDARLLVLAGDGREPALAAVRQTLDFLGTPYDVVNAAGAAAFGAARLHDGRHGFYQGVVLVTDTLAVPAGDGQRWQSGLRAAGWAALDEYEASFGVRRACLYTHPRPETGFAPGTPADTRAAPLTLHFTPAGASVFGWCANVEQPVSVAGVSAYLAAPLDHATLPLLIDEGGHAAAAVRQLPRGREALLMTFDHGPRQLHALRLLPGVIGWVTRGLFVGERRAYLAAQVDDLFRASALRGGGTYRITGEELRRAVAWQQRRRAAPVTASLRLAFAFNGDGTRQPDDDLTAAARQLGGAVEWISHSYRHIALNDADHATTLAELSDNDACMRELALGPYCPENLVTPEVSGLANPQVMRAVAEFGVRQVVSDSSRAGYDNPSPNVGLPNPHAPSVLMVPRRPTNLFFDVSTPQEWTAAYNGAYRASWGRDLGVDEILDRESDALLGYLLCGDIDPWMFHQANLRLHDGAHALLTDLLDRALDKYARCASIPILSLPMEEIAARMRQRQARAQAGLVVRIEPGRAITLRADGAARVAVTGLATPDAERYGAQVIATVDVPAGGQVTLPLAGL